MTTSPDPRPDRHELYALAEPTTATDAPVEHWAQLIEAHLSDLTARGTTPATRALRSGQLRRLAREHPHSGPGQLTRADLLHHLAHPTWATGTRRTARKSLVAFYGWARTTGHLGHDPAADLPPADRIAPRPYAAPTVVDDAATRRAVVSSARHPARTWAQLTGRPYAETGRLPRALLDAWHAAGAPVLAEPPAVPAVDQSDAHPEMVALPVDPWAQLLDPYTRELFARGLRPATVAAYRSRLLSFARSCGRPPADVTRTDLVDHLAEPTWSPSTRKAQRSALSSLFAWAHDEGHITTNPAARLPKVRVPNGVPSPAPETVIRDAINGARPDVRLMVLLGALAGLRRAEIATLHTDAITLDGLRVVGKGGRSRIIPLHPSLSDELDTYRTARGIGRGHLFCPPDSTEPYTTAHVGSLISRRMPAGWSAHKLRHRFASRSYAGQYNLRAVQELLGHSSPAVTACYVAIPDAAARDAVLAVPPIPGIEAPHPNRPRSLRPGTRVDALADASDDEDGWSW